MKPEDVDQIQRLLEGIRQDQALIEEASQNMSEKISSIESLTGDFHEFDYTIRKAKRTSEDFMRRSQNMNFVNRVSRDLRPLKRRLIRDQDRKRRERRTLEETEDALRDLRRYLNRE